MELAEVPVPEDPLDLFAALKQDHRHAFLLQSAGGPERFGRYSIVGFGPETTITDPDELTPDVLAPVRDADRRLPFEGGLVGYTSWELVGEHPRVPTRDPAPFPLVDYGLFLDGVVYDHAIGRALYFTHGPDRRDELPSRGDADAAELAVGELKPRRSRDAFEASVRQAKEAIRDGEVFQVVLSRALTAGFDGSLLPFYRRLLGTNPSPYMFFLDFDGRQIVGSSPEMLVNVPDGVRVETFPIAGTRPLGDSPEQTRKLAAEMASDPKELAEHVMLVDLARNDVGRVARYGTVAVEERERIETYSHVQHLVSKVTGTLRSGLSAFDAYRAIFPAGTVSGAPKVRAMELIDDLEAAPRGPYAGSVGYFSGSGASDHAITIRSLMAHDDRLRVQAGAGIVDDSDPSREFDETTQKMDALTQILEELGSA